MTGHTIPPITPPTVLPHAIPPSVRARPAVTKPQPSLRSDSAASAAAAAMAAASPPPSTPSNPFALLLLAALDTITKGSTSSPTDPTVTGMQSGIETDGSQPTPGSELLTPPTFNIGAPPVTSMAQSPPQAVVTLPPDVQIISSLIQSVAAPHPSVPHPADAKPTTVASPSPTLISSILPSVVSAAMTSDGQSQRNSLPKALMAVKPKSKTEPTTMAPAEHDFSPHATLEPSGTKVENTAKPVERKAQDAPEKQATQATQARSAESMGQSQSDAPQAVVAMPLVSTMANAPVSTSQTQSTELVDHNQFTEPLPEPVPTPPRTDRVTLQLPDEAGQARIQVSVRSGGEVSARIMSSDPATNTQLSAGLGELKDALTRQGFDQVKLAVPVAPSATSTSQQTRNETQHEQPSPSHQRDQNQNGRPNQRPRRERER